MEQTIQALGGILLNAVPTFFLVLFLYFYLNRVFFRPMNQVLRQREEATDGARRAAEASLALAAAKTAEYEASLREARSEIYRDQEELRNRLRRQQEDAVREARERSEQSVREARAQLAADVEAAKRDLRTEAEGLADQIVVSVLGNGRVN